MSLIRNSDGAELMWTRRFAVWYLAGLRDVATEGQFNASIYSDCEFYCYRDRHNRNEAPRSGRGTDVNDAMEQAEAMLIAMGAARRVDNMGGKSSAPWVTITDKRCQPNLPTFVNIMQGQPFVTSDDRLLIKYGANRAYNPATGDLENVGDNDSATPVRITITIT